MKRCPLCAESFQVDQRFCAVHGLPLVEEVATGSRQEGALTGLILDGRYRLAGVAGRGGMGVVYEAENLRIGRRCAVKVLHPELNADPKMRMRLFREVQATSRVQHPNVVEILDFGDEQRAGSYLVMEFLEGRSLSEIIRTEAPLSPAMVLPLAAQLCSALIACHNCGLIHRDLKPSNVRVSADGHVKVLDFGLVKPFNKEDHAGAFVTITTGGIAFGTPWYMSPEQASFQPLDPRTDIYSAGVILYEMLVGRPPFSGENPLELIDAHRSQPVPLPSALDPPIILPPALEMLILKALSKKPEERHQRASELSDELMRIAQQLGVSLGGIQVTAASPLSTLEELQAPPAVLETQPVTLQDLPTAAFEQEIRARLVDVGFRVASVLQAVIPRYRAMDPDQLAAGASISLETALEACCSATGELPERIRQLADQRSREQFSPSEIIGAMALELSMMRPLLRDAGGGNAEKARRIEDQIDRRMLSFIVKLSDYYFARYHARLMELNERLTSQNEELSKLRAALTDQLNQASRQLVESEELKARVVESINSGVLLVERNSRIIRIYNRTMENLTGIAASQAIGRRIEEVLSFVEGVPLEEFMEQLRMHGQVGLRKLWIRLPNGPQKAIYVSGQAFKDAAGEPTYTLMVVEDVTEREAIIESFSRYLSRDVVDQVLRRGRSGQSSGETRRVVMLEVNIRGFRRLSKELPLESVVELLTEYVRAVSEAVFHHGGTIESVMGDSLLVYFDHLRGTTRPAVSAAIEICRRLTGTNVKRALRDLPPIEAGVGVHVGEVLAAHVGGKRRMVHTMVGEASRVAHSLQLVAAGGEILISTAVADGLGPEPALENGPQVVIEGHSSPIEAFRVTFDPTPLSETSA